MRKPKSSLAAWIVAGRKERAWTSAQLAQRLDVAESTVRGWEAGRSVKAENLDELEKLYGVEAPGRDQAAGGDLASAIRELTAELRAMREERQALFDRLTGLEARPAFDAEALEAVRQLAESDEVRTLLRARASHPGMPTG